MNSVWYVEYEDTHKADGIILLGYGDFVDYEEKLKQLIEQDTHFVRWGSPVKDLPVASIGCDNYRGGITMGQHLMQQGHQQCAFIGEASSHAPEFFDRYLRGDCSADEQKQFESACKKESSLKSEFETFKQYKLYLSSASEITASEQFTNSVIRTINQKSGICLGATYLTIILTSFLINFLNSLIILEVIYTHSSFYAVSCNAVSVNAGKNYFTPPSVYAVKN